jgi:hypothetical protein
MRAPDGLQHAREKLKLQKKIAQLKAKCTHFTRLYKASQAACARQERSLLLKSRHLANARNSSS